MADIDLADWPAHIATELKGLSLAERLSAPAELLHVIPPGVDLPHHAQLPAPRPASRVPVVGAAGALEPQKGLLYFLMAAELILSSGYDVEFLIAGSGPEEATLRRAAIHLDIANRVTFVGYVSEFGDVLAALDLFVASSIEPGQVSVTLEALALAKPTVATSVGGLADFFQDNKHVLSVPPANHVALAERIKLLLDNPARARQLAAAGQRLVREEFSADRMAASTADLYRAILARAA